MSKNQNINVGRDIKDVFMFASIRKNLILIYFLFVFILFAPTILLAECISANCTNGYGIYVHPDGSRYDGEFRNGIYHGRGKWSGSDGSRYDGEFRDGKRNGTGTYVWDSGHKYTGEYANDKRNGNGTLTNPDGSIWAGEWRDDKQIDKIVYPPGFFPDDISPIKQTNYTPYIVVLAIIIVLVIIAFILRWKDKTSTSSKQERTSSTQQKQNSSSNKSSGFKSKVEDNQRSEDKLNSAQSSTGTAVRNARSSFRFSMNPESLFVLYCLIAIPIYPYNFSGVSSVETLAARLGQYVGIILMPPLIMVMVYERHKNSRRVKIASNIAIILWMMAMAITAYLGR